MKIKLFTSDAKSQKEIVLPKEFSEKINKSLLDQSLRVYEDNVHSAYAKAKTRSQVNRTKKKVYKQKGTGGARHGAKSAPIFVGGGVAHGPKGIKKQLSLSKKIKKLALRTAISYLCLNQRCAVVEGLTEIDKTKKASKIINLFIKNLKLNKNAKLMVVLGDLNPDKFRFYKNIDNISVLSFKNINAYRLLTSQFVLFDSVIFTKEVKKNSKK